MEPPAKSQKEREDTDESLRSERSKTDQELERARRDIEEDADRVVEVARERAEAVLDAARERTDEQLAAKGASADTQFDLATERVQEDRALADERATADERLHLERAERKRALANLLSLERDATDERLLVERERADGAVASRDDFLGMVSHDLRSLLGGIALNSALLTKHARTQGEAGAEMLRSVERIQRFTARMNRLIGDLLDVVSLEAGKLAVSPKPCDAVRLVRDAVEAFEPQFSAEGITLRSHTEVASIRAQCDDERILQVLANMLSNALKFTERGGSVTLTVKPLDTQVCFSVTDSGIGLPEGAEQSIFERFRQVMTKDRRGLGLGLYIAKCIVEAHGGRIWAERLERGGTSLHFTLPGVDAA